jgi:hypothetical protein
MDRMNGIKQAISNSVYPVSRQVSEQAGDLFQKKQIETNHWIPLIFAYQRELGEEESF